MNKRRTRNPKELSPLLRIPLSLIAIAVLLYLSVSAVRFCLGLFVTGDYIVSFPGFSNPVVQESLRPNSDKNVTGLLPQTEDDETAAQVHYATVSVAGDIITHMPVVNSGATEDGYDYTGIFSYLNKYLKNADYAAANLETTLSGTDHGNTYTGSPQFNAPDAFADAAKDAGFDLLLTGNDHCYDYGTYGLKRTLDILKNRGLDSLGTTSTSGAPRYILRDLNGIQVGMICYTYADLSTGRDTPTTNGLTADTNASGLINAFGYNNQDLFRTEMETHIANMKADGAEAIMVYLHWGTEYSLDVGNRQKEIAQMLCDLGVDVIVGSHSHTVQPVELYTSTTDPSHTAVCIYSVGNLVSNQRADNSAMTTGHTEDGLLFSVTFAEYENGGVYLDSVDLMPLWVLLQGTGSERSYQILPLDSELNWKTVFQLSTEELQDAQASYTRTQEIINSCADAVTETLTAARDARNAELLSTE